MPLLDQAAASAVARDGLPRQATADDGSAHVLYLETHVVRSMTADLWPPPLPKEPTAAVISAAIAARNAAAEQARADAAALRTRVRTLAQSAVGVQIDALSAPQVRALIATLLHKAGAIDASGGIRPLSEWE